MDWFRAVDGYCERLGPGYWAEPVNALTNAAFLVAAAYGWRLASRADDTGGRLLAANLAVIGMGSYLFHTHAVVWALFADVLPIQTFILIYLCLATRRFFGASWLVAAIATLAFVPASRAVAAGITALAGPLNGSAGYLPVPILLAAFAVALARRTPATARGLAVGTALLAVSLAFRTIDAAVCGVWPLGTHFLWHLLNAAMLGWMIRVLVRHACLAPHLAPGGAAR